MNANVGDALVRRVCLLMNADREPVAMTCWPETFGDVGDYVQVGELRAFQGVSNSRRFVILELLRKEATHNLIYTMPLVVDDDLLEEPPTPWSKASIDAIWDIWCEALADCWREFLA